MKVGDLVKIAPHCKNKGRMAIVVCTDDHLHIGVWIKYLDGKGSGTGLSKDGYAMINNLILLSASKELSDEQLENVIGGVSPQRLMNRGLW